MKINPLFTEIKTLLTPALWSEAVQMARSAQFAITSQEEDKISLQLHLPGQKIHPCVELWPKDLDWKCTCPSKQDPCLHVTAAVIHLKNPSVKKDSDLQTMVYSIEKENQKIQLQRYLKSDSTLKPDPYVDGDLTGRTQVTRTSCDLQVERLLHSRKKNFPLTERKEILEILSLLKPTHQLVFAETPIEIQNQTLNRTIQIEDKNEGLKLTLKDSFVKEEILLQTSDWLIHKNKLYFQTSIKWLKNHLPSFTGTEVFIPRKDRQNFVVKILPEIEKQYNVTHLSQTLPKLKTAAPFVDLYIQKNNNGDLVVTPRLFYGSPVLAQKVNGSMKYEKEDIVILEDTKKEQELRKKLKYELQLQIDRPTNFPNYEALEFMQRAEAWSKSGQVDLYKEQPTLIPEVQLIDDRLSVSLKHPKNSDSIPFDQAWDCWQKEKSQVQLLSGQWTKLPKEWFEKYAAQLQSLLLLQEKKRQIPKYAWPQWATLNQELGLPQPKVLETFQKLVENFTSIPQAPLPKDLTASLRPYQKQAVNWLSFLQKHHLGALLADDMGLGKTLQTLCVLQGQCLIVCPTSVLRTWEKEIEKFRPQLSASIYHGPQRTLKTQSQIIITSYGVLKRDLSELCQRHWDNIVLDESQIIKNHKSQVAQAISQVPGDFRVALSGTPIENRLQDLYSQFDFILPGFLTQTHQNTETLKKQIQPFFLRRLKEDVAQDLPPKTEMIIRCELSSDERDLYNSLLSSTQQEIVDRLQEGQDLFSLLELLLRLRQSCSHPHLLPGQKLTNNFTTSTKVETLIERLHNTIPLGHKVLIFSQWTGFLDIIEKRLEQESISSCRLDGKTKERNKIIDLFQSKDGPSTMLISLKAGGVGLTLTQADHIYIMDPWWNPASEEQAADRAHRIGQDKPVFVHKLICENTLEERIIELQEKKQELARSVLDGAGQASLTRDDILFLLSSNEGGF